MRKLLTLILVAMAAAGCHHGQQIASMTIPVEPNGAHATLELSTGSVYGELLAAESDGLFLLAENRLVRVSLNSVRTARIDEFGSYSFNGIPSAEQLRHVRLISHFPGGISPAIRERLLAMYHQTDWATLP